MAHVGEEFAFEPDGIEGGIARSFKFRLHLLPEVNIETRGADAMDATVSVPDKPILHQDGHSRAVFAPESPFKRLERHFAGDF